MLGVHAAQILARHANAQGCMSVCADFSVLDGVCLLLYANKLDLDQDSPLDVNEVRPTTGVHFASRLCRAPLEKLALRVVRSGTTVHRWSI